MVDIARIAVTAQDRRLMLFQPSPSLLPFMEDESPRIFVRAANRTGKTKHAAAKLAKKMLAKPGGRYRAVGVSFQQSTSVVSRYLHEFLPPSQLAPTCRFSMENGWTHQLIVLRNGSTCEIRSGDQRAITHAGSDLDGVWLDEVQPPDIFVEALTRTMSRNGWVWQTATPIGRPVEYLRAVVEAERSAWVQHVVPLSHEACPWYSDDQVDAWIEEARAFPDSYDQKILGAWEGITLERTFTGFDSTCLIDPTTPSPTGIRLGVGIDHGEGVGRQVAVLVAYSQRGIWALDEVVNTTSTTPTDDARAIRTMLMRRGYDVHQVSRWVGDINSAGKLGAGQKVNELLAMALAKEAGHHKLSFRIEKPNKVAGSVDWGEKLMNASFLRHQLWVHPGCVSLIKALRHSRGGAKDPDLQHPLDALRYISHQPLELLQPRSATTAQRYQLP